MTEWKPHITIRALNPVVAGLRALGHPVEAALHHAGMSLKVLDDPDGEVPHDSMMRFWEHALAATADDYLGIHVADAAPIESFEVHAYALLSSSTLREAYRRGCRYQRLIHESTHLMLEESSEEGVLIHSLPGGLNVPRHPAEFLVTVWVRLGRLVTGDNWYPSRVCFAHPAPTNTAEHQRIFGKHVRFRTGRTAMHVPLSFLEKANRRADPGLVELLDRYAASLLHRKPRRATLSDRVRAWLVESHGCDAPTATACAKGLHMSIRTLHRHLKREGVTFTEVLDHFRREKAAELLAARQHSIAEAAFLLGFSELSSFYRAFRRWTGETPSEFRTGIAHL